MGLRDGGDLHLLQQATLLGLWWDTDRGGVVEYKAQEVSSGEHPGDRGHVYQAQQQGAGHWLVN